MSKVQYILLIFIHTNFGREIAIINFVTFD